MVNLWNHSETASYIWRFKQMKKFLAILWPLISIGANQLSAQKHPDWDKLRPLINSTKDFYDENYGLDPDYETGGAFPFAVEDLKYSRTVLFQYFFQKDSSKNKLKAVIGKYHVAKFDDHGNKTFEKYDAWTAGANFKYEYNSYGHAVSISMVGHVLGRAKYKYDSLGKLLQVGELLFKYYDCGLLKSVEDRSEIEIYQYDSAGRLIHMYFYLKPGVVGCGNRTTEWKGEYNDKGQLVIEHLFGFPEFTKYHEYSKVGLLIKTTTKDDLFANTMTKYFYEKGKLRSAKTYDITGKILDTQQYFY